MDMSRRVFFAVLGCFLSASLSGAHRKVIRDDKELEDFLQQKLHPDAPVVGVPILLETYTKGFFKNTPLVKYFARKGNPIDVGRIWRIAGQNANKDKSLITEGRLAGWHFLRLVGLDKVTEFRIFRTREIQLAAELKARESFLKKEAKLEAEKLKVEQARLVMVAKQQELEKERRAAAKEANKLAIELMGRRATVAALLVGCILASWAFAKGFLLPLFRAMFPQKNLTVYIYKNFASNLFEALGRRSKPPAIKKGFYNPAEREKLQYQRSFIKLWLGAPALEADNILLHGPPGSGKNLFVDSLKHLDARIAHVSGGSIAQLRASKHSGEAKRYLRELVRPKGDKKTILIVDEVDVMLEDDLRSILGDVNAASSKLLIIFATNRLSEVPEAVRDRCVEIEIAAPSEATIARQFAHFLAKARKDVAIDLSKEQAEDLVAKMFAYGFSGRKVEKVVRRARNFSLSSPESKDGLSYADFLKELAMVAQTNALLTKETTRPSRGAPRQLTRKSRI